MGKGTGKNGENKERESLIKITEFEVRPSQEQEEIEESDYMKTPKIVYSRTSPVTKKYKKIKNPVQISA